MPARKMRVEVFDGDGNRYTVTFEGHVTRDKALRLLDIVELLGGMPRTGSELDQRNPELSKFDKVRYIVKESFPVVWFSSRDVQSLYEQKLKEPISLSTVSTYLSRMADRGFLAKNKMSNSRRYRMITEISRSTLGFMKGNK
jgi:DNA-binding transcriptional ArsR family regulator